MICSTIPGFDIPEKRIEKEIVPGRSGYLTIDQEAYESIVKSVTFHVVDNVNVDVLKSWLIGMERVTDVYKRELLTWLGGQRTLARQ